MKVPILEYVRASGNENYSIITDKLSKVTKQIGKGSNGTAFELGNKVLKVYKRQDRAYTSFVEFSQDYDSIHLPKIIEHGQGKKVHYVVSEKLSPLNRQCYGLEPWKLIAISSDYYQGYKATYWKNSIPRSLFETLDDMRLELGEDSMPDICNKNVGLRNRTLVLIDPVC